MLEPTRPSQPRAQRPREVYLHGEPSAKPRHSSQHSPQPVPWRSTRSLAISSALTLILVIVWLLLLGLNNHLFG